MRKKIKAGILGLLLFTNVQAALAQKPGYVKGRLSDIAGAAVAKNKVTIEDASSTYETVTDENGEFAFELPPGIYKISTEKIPGLVPLRLNKLELKSKQTRVLRVRLRAEDMDAGCKIELLSTPVNKAEQAGKKP
jgi:hypothetical protein